MATDIDVPNGMHLSSDEPGGPIAAPVAIENTAEGGEGEAQERPRSSREIAMEAIYRRRQDAIANEVSQGVEREVRQREDEGEPPPARVADVGRANEPALPPQGEQAAQAPQQPQLFPINRGDGQQVYVTAEQLVTLAQDGVLARLAVNQHQRAQSESAPPAPQPGAAPAAPAGSDLAHRSQAAQLAPDLDAARTEEYVRRLTFGDATEGARALADFGQELLQRTRQMAPDPQQLIQAATQQALAHIRAEQQQQSLERNLNTIGTEFPDVFSDRSLSQLAAIKVGELRQQHAISGTRKSDLDLYRDACQEVRRVTGRADATQVTDRAQQTANQSASQAAPSQAAVSAAKIERKRAAPQQPSAVSRVAPGEEASSSVGRRSDIVEQMRRARGQASMR